MYQHLILFLLVSLIGHSNISAQAQQPLPQNAQKSENSISVLTKPLQLIAQNHLKTEVQWIDVETQTSLLITKPNLHKVTYGKVLLIPNMGESSLNKSTFLSLSDHLNQLGWHVSHLIRSENKISLYEQVSAAINKINPDNTDELFIILGDQSSIEVLEQLAANNFKQLLVTQHGLILFISSKLELLPEITKNLEEIVSLNRPIFLINDSHVDLVKKIQIKNSDNLSSTHSLGNRNSNSVLFNQIHGWLKKFTLLDPK